MIDNGRPFIQKLRYLNYLNAYFSCQTLDHHIKDCPVRKIRNPKLEEVQPSKRGARKEEEVFKEEHNSGNSGNGLSHPKEVSNKEGGDVQRFKK